MLRPGRLEYSNLRLEYYPDRRLASLAMTESIFHATFASEKEMLIKCAAKQHVPALESIKASIKTRGENDRKGLLKPDGGILRFHDSIFKQGARLLGQGDRV
ncbi:hypothetical protein ColTof4_09380 [Colletotrichum tofieldiae]|nr:hypothetical protein ColTof3_12668 [Colletotrichum tofieldiae]GKT76957.1 hypothetical protein ColTof4_09380 [Colletotrichum tofieldiae]GKT92594.1 hypothetical protein Ct61P_10444 [Colletotrichum tofieldiae]